ncbi:RtcB family protein [Gordonia jinghuaiqii]|uniref:3'-phosphate/5'-hydroxy nucleic acid ligase n=1 Tax=Gordonia jinghuaiqii TaxID=2758710 RepID=A0A7D7LPT2_9ACTN|nr:RtcB family protein [Gordonia jinghuaiqii]MCR5977154.1 RtcB family protein [Gordonia jinghuaiqii]QMT00243.1 RtcB family protein [Gordonia jinghuaiqii]
MPTMASPKVLNYASHVDDNALRQAAETARLPFVHPHIALMPDAHAGKGSAVGTVIPTTDAVIPAAVGVDIGCGMIAVETRLGAADIDGMDLAALRRAIEAAIPLSPGNYNRGLDRFVFTRARIDSLAGQASDTGVDLSHSPKWREQLGSLGGGNHFIELCLDERDIVWLFLHSGSRGVGNKIAQKHIKIAQKLCRQWSIQLPNADLAYLAQGTPELAAYLRELKWAQRFAFENRAEMMDRFVEVFADWYASDAGDVDAVPLEVDRINCHHNYTVKETHGGKDVWLTRKGAIDAHKGVRGVIPGSMGTRSYVVRGKGNESGLCSAPHGAGRRFSRTEARKRFTADDLAARMAGIEYRHGEEWVDEIPDAYKDIDQVMADAVDLVDIEHTLRQILNVKGT